MDIPWISTNSNGYTMDISMGVFSDTSSPHLPSRTTRRVSCLTDVMLQLCQVLLISHFLLLAKSASLVLCIYSIFNSAKKMEIYEIGNQIYAYIYTYLNKIIYIHARNHKDIIHLQQPQLIILVSQFIYLESQKHMFLVIVAKNRNDHVFFCKIFCLPIMTKTLSNQKNMTVLPVPTPYFFDILLKKGRKEP